MVRLRGGVVALVGLAVVAALPGCGGGNADVPFTEVRRIPAAQATGLAVGPDLDLLVGERLTGRIRTIDAATGRTVDERTLADLDTDLVQGGLLGLAVADREVVASYVATDGHLVVATVAANGATSTRWHGPEAQEEANGGRLATVDGQLVIGIGDLLDPERKADPGTPNGKLLVIGDDGTTTPYVGDVFNNPFALVSAGDGVLWVADNAPGSTRERLVRVGPAGAEEVVSWSDTRVPTGIAVVDDDHVAICNFATAELRLVDVSDPGDGEGRLVADDCRYGVISLPKGGLAYAAEDAVVILGPT